MIRVERAVGYLAVQDLGRPGHRAAGVPAGGAMDPVALRLANLLVGNAEGDAALEWSVGETVLRVDRATLVAVAGAGARVTLDGVDAPLFTTLRAAAGSELRLAPAADGRFCCIAVEGGLDLPPVLGSRATYLPARLGGHEGRALRSGDAIPIGARKAGARRAPAPGTTVPDTLRPSDASSAPIRLVAAAQHAVLDDDGWRLLLDPEHRIGAGDRMGYRLDGPAIPTRAAAALPSEGACAGALQLPGDGHAIVLMPDGPTVGGYPKPAVVASVDLPRLAQRPAGAAVRFTLIDVAEAQRLRRELEERLDAVRRALGGASGEG